MLIAVLTDIHGNSVALDTAVADAQAIGVDRFWLLGDLVAMGPDPIGTAERLRALQPATSTGSARQPPGTNAFFPTAASPSQSTPAPSATTAPASLPTSPTMNSPPSSPV